MAAKSGSPKAKPFSKSRFSPWSGREIVYPWIQIPFLLTVAGFGLFCAGSVCLVAWLYLQGTNPQTLYIVGTCLVFLSTAILWMSLALSNRVLGPIYRLQLELKKLADTGVIPNDFKVRDTDFLPELASNYEAVLHRIKKDDKE